MMLRPTSALLLIIATLVGQDGISLSSAFTTCTKSFRIARSTNSILQVSKSSSNNIQTTSSTSTNYEPDFASASEIDAQNTPPSLQTILTSLSELKSGSDLRGTFIPHNNSGGTIVNISHLIKRYKEDTGGVALTPFAAHCFGVAFARWLVLNNQHQSNTEGKEDEPVTICIGRDPRIHGERLADSFARGGESVEGVKVVYTGVTNTPSMYEFVR